MGRLEQEYAERGQRSLFDWLRSFLLSEQEDTTYAEAAATLGLTAAAMKMAASRMRARCRELLREESAQTADGPREIERRTRRKAHRRPPDLHFRNRLAWAG